MKFDDKPWSQGKQAFQCSENDLVIYFKGHTIGTNELRFKHSDAVVMTDIILCKLTGVEMK